MNRHNNYATSFIWTAGSFVLQNPFRPKGLQRICHHFLLFNSSWNNNQKTGIWWWQWFARAGWGIHHHLNIHIVYISLKESGWKRDGIGGVPLHIETTRKVLIFSCLLLLACPSARHQEKNATIGWQERRKSVGFTERKSTLDWHTVSDLPRQDEPTQSIRNRLVSCAEVNKNCKHPNIWIDCCIFIFIDFYSRKERSGWNGLQRGECWNATLSTPHGIAERAERLFECRNWNAM